MSVQNELASYKVFLRKREMQIDLTNKDLEEIEKIIKVAKYRKKIFMLFYIALLVTTIFQIILMKESAISQIAYLFVSTLNIVAGVILSIFIFLYNNIDNELNKFNELNIKNKSYHYNNTFPLLLLNIVEHSLQNISLKTWQKTSDCFFDTIETFPDELSKWKERNLKFVAYLILATELAGFFYYFTKTAISNAIATRRISS